MQEITPELVHEAIQYGDAHLAVLSLNWAKKHPELTLTDAEVLQLKYVRINSLSVAKLSELLKQSLLTAYTLPDYLLSEAIETYAGQLDLVNDEIMLYRNILPIIEHCTETLGTVDVVIGGSAVATTIANWFKDFTLFSKNVQKTALDEAQYITTSPNVRKLPEHEREVLRDILNLYDDCESKLYEWESIPEAKTDEDGNKLLQGMDLFESFPELAEDLHPTYAASSDVKPSTLANDTESNLVSDPILAQTMAVKETSPVKSVAPPVVIPTIIPKKVEPVIREVSVNEKSVANNIPVGVQDKVVPKHLKPQEEPFRIAQNQGNIQQPKRGLVFNVPTNIDLSEIEDTAKQQEQKQQAITQKLAELKKRHLEDGDTESTN